MFANASWHRLQSFCYSFDIRDLWNGGGRSFSTIMPSKNSMNLVNVRGAPLQLPRFYGTIHRQLINSPPHSVEKPEKSLALQHRGRFQRGLISPRKTKKKSFLLSWCSKAIISRQPAVINHSTMTMSTTTAKQHQQWCGDNNGANEPQQAKGLYEAGRRES